MRQATGYAALWLSVGLLLNACGTSGGAPAGRLAVVTKFADAVELIDLAERSVVARYAVGRGPHEVAASPDDGRLYVSNYGNDLAETGTGISIIELARGTVREVPVAPYLNPHGLAVGEQGRRLWLTVQGPGLNAVLALDGTTGEILGAFPTGQDYTHMVIALPGQVTLAATNITSGSVTLIERTSGRTESVATGAGAADAAVSPDGRWLYVPNEDANTISVVDLAAREVVETIAAGGRRPVRVEVTPDGSEVWISYFAEPFVGVFDAATRARIATIRLPAVQGEGAIGLLFSPDGRRAFVSHMEADRVFVIDSAARAVVDVLETGRGPDGMAFLR